MGRYVTIISTALLAIATLALWAWANAQLMPAAVHTAAEIERAHRLSGLVPQIAVALTLVGATITLLSWRRFRGPLYRAVSLLPVLGLVAGVVVARGTVVEMLMFSPVREARFTSVAEVAFLQPESLVLGVVVGGESKAYPVGMLAYHHIVNDRLAGEAYVATY